MRKIWAACAALLLAVSLTSCSAGTGSTAQNTHQESQSGQLDGTLTVFAAASLKQPFTQLAKDFEEANPGSKVQLSFDGSSTLASQITAGAPADVFASADQANMKKISEAKLTNSESVVFATNSLTGVVPLNNPANIGTFADMTKPGIKLVICAPKVPCGAAAATDAAAAGLALKPVSEELNVTSVLSKVTSGEADAGLVYVTDAKSAGSTVKQIPLKLTAPTINKYPIAAVKGSKNQALAEAFIAMVTGALGQRTLQSAGFGAP